MSKCVIYQPFWAPPIYLFSRMMEADTLVWLDEFKVEKGAHNRALFGAKGGDIRHTVPVSSIERAQFAIIPNHEHHAKKIRKTLEAAYAPAPRYGEVMEALEAYGAFEGPRFSLQCFRIYEALYRLITGKAPNVTFSSLHQTESMDPSARLAFLTRVVGCDTYYCSADATDKYLDLEPFKMLNVKVEFQNYLMPTYEARGSMQSIARRSILDLVMWNSNKECLRVLTP